jgi:hypothetical protein
LKKEYGHGFLVFLAFFSASESKLETEKKALQMRLDQLYAARVCAEQAEEARRQGPTPGGPGSAPLYGRPLPAPFSSASFSYHAASAASVAAAFNAKATTAAPSASAAPATVSIVAAPAPSKAATAAATAAEEADQKQSDKKEASTPSSQAPTATVYAFQKFEVAVDSDSESEGSDNSNSDSDSEQEGLTQHQKKLKKKADRQRSKKISLHRSMVAPVGLSLSDDSVRVSIVNWQSVDNVYPGVPQEVNEIRYCKLFFFLQPFDTVSLMEDKSKAQNAVMQQFYVSDLSLKFLY